MQSIYADNDISLPYEEKINGFIIYIEDNADRWRGGYSWSVCKDEVELDSGLAFDVTDALERAYSCTTV